MQDDLEDERVFGDFISGELRSLEKWYSDRKGTPIPEDVRLARIKEIQDQFVKDVRPKLRDKENFARFEKADLNNARLLTYKLYFQDLSQFQRVFDKLGGDFAKMLDFCRSLEKSNDPVADLAKAAGA
jgi:predicted aminopeptidase